MELEIGTKLICKKDIKVGCKSWNGNPYLFRKGQECKVLFRMNPTLEPNSYGVSNPQSFFGHTILPIEDIIKDFDIM